VGPSYLTRSLLLELTNSARLQQYLISNRNKDVTKALENIYREQLPGNDLKVFCVDNVMYQDHRTEPKDDALPFLQLSGIFAVRKHCIAMVASSQLRYAMKYMNDDIPAFLGDVELWVQSGAGTVDAERRGEIRETLNVLEARLQGVRYGPRPSRNILMDGSTSQAMLLISIGLQDQVEKCSESTYRKVYTLNPL